MNKKILKYSMIITLICLYFNNSFASDLDIFKGEKGIIKISGGTAHIPVMKQVAKKIMSFNSDIQISIAGGGSGIGIKQVGEGLVDIGNSGRQPSEKEIQKYGLKVYKWAIDGVAAIVNINNLVTKLTTQQLKDIFSGKILNWKTVDGCNRSINVYTRDSASGTQAVFWKKALNKENITGKANFVVSNGAMKSAISNDPFGIGYVSIGFIDSNTKTVVLDEVLPSITTIKKGNYKIARGIYSCTRGDADGLYLKLINYLLSPEVQKIVAEKGFIPVK